ncbi:MAG: NUDIX domain-containing protein [Actinomycetota bacterium]|nr:NUDIX domain-containing protein [Actinomycetota bacterium]
MGEETPKHSVSVAAAVVRDDGRVLAIQRRDNAHWEPPGGVLELDETIEDGLRREVREETGLEVQVERLTGVYKNMELGVVALVFRCRHADGAPAPTREAAEVAWLDPSEVEARMEPAYAVRMMDALVPAAQAEVRAHDGTEVL